MTRRTRIKICGLTRQSDVDVATRLGADALGFVFYEKNPSYLTPEAAQALIERLPPFVTTVGLFVNADAATVLTTTQRLPLTLLQFHGDESPEDCAALAAAVNRPFMRTCRIAPETTPDEIADFESRYRAASPHFAALVLDTATSGFGGSGQSFDWSVLPSGLAQRAVLAGGLTPDTVGGAISRFQPYAVDVSSAVESAKGIKDADKMARFIAALRRADFALP